MILVSVGANVNKGKKQGKVRLGREATEVAEPRDKMRKPFPYSISQRLDIKDNISKSLE